MPRILIPILACLVLVGGCGERWTAEDLEWLKHTEAMLDTIEMLVYENCRPCQPETVTLLVKIDSTTYYDGGAEHHWSYVSPDTVYQMPPGQWVKPGQHDFMANVVWSDSVFILSKSGAVPSSLREE
ncbi:MAG: hypothetical protein IMF11_20220 [Proteobacteria bacterium]|nr:hypothetical protein [Pseudomonadota bacterium]